MASDSSAVEKLRRALVEEIDSGVHPAGARLGGERELASRHGVSRGTLRQALAALEEAGLVRRVPGRGGGTFVSHAKVERDLSAIQSVPGLLLSQGYDAGSKVVGTQLMLAPERVRTALGLGSADLVVAVTRIRLADGRPISIDHAYFPAERVPGLLDQALGGSLYELLADEYGIVPADVEERVEVVPATDEEAALLGIAPDAPLLLVRRIARDADGRPFEYSKDLFRGDRTCIRMRTAGRGIRRHVADGGTVVELWGGSELPTG